MELKKKEWKHPELIVLLKSRPEERILDNCKLPPMYAHPGQSNLLCQDHQGGNGCVHCTALGVS